MNIQIPELEHKYINLYDTQEEYEADKERYEEVNYSIVKNPQATEDNYSEFQYSTRTTNNDNQVMAKYWDSETPNLWAGLKIIWGYFGWQETTIELLGETLTGGNFYNAGKNMTTVLSIPDGDTLQHIDNFTYNLYDKTTHIFPIKEIQQFDTSNIKSAMNFVFPRLSNDCTLKQLEWNSVLRAVMNYIKPTGPLQFNSAKYLNLVLLSSYEYYAPNIEYEIIQYYIPYQEVINVTVNNATEVNPICTNFGLTTTEAVYTDTQVINITIPKSNNIKTTYGSYDTDTFTFTPRSLNFNNDSNQILNLSLSTISNGEQDTDIQINITDLNDYDDNGYSLIKVNRPSTINLTLSESYKFYVSTISGMLNNIPISQLRREDSCEALYNNCSFYCPIEIDLYSDYIEGSPICTKERYILHNCDLTRINKITLHHLNKVDNLIIRQGNVSQDFVWDINFDQSCIYRKVQLEITNLTHLIDDFHINVLGQNPSEYRGVSSIFKSSNIDYSNSNSYVNIIPYIKNDSNTCEISIMLDTTNYSPRNMRVYVNKDLINIYDYWDIQFTDTQKFELDINIISNSNTYIDISEFNVYDTFCYLNEDNVKQSLVTENADIYIIGRNPSLNISSSVEHALLGYASGLYQVSIRNASSMDLNEFVQNILDTDTNYKFISNGSSLSLLRTQYDQIPTDQQTSLLEHFGSLNIIDT